MDYTPKELENLAKMDSLLARLQVCAAVRVEAIERMQIATSGLEMQRQTRAIKMVADLVVDLHSPVRPPKSRSKHRPERAAPSSDSWDSLSSTLDGLLKKLPPKPPKPGKAALRPQREALLAALEVKSFDIGTAAPPSPPYAKHGEVAFAQRMTEGSNAGEGNTPPPAESAPETLEDLQIQATVEATELVNTATHACARWAGIWPDGARFTEGDSHWRRHTLTAIPAIDLTKSADISTPVRQEILNRTNAIARAYGRHFGIGLDGCQHRDHMPDLWSLSTNLDSRRHHPAPGEIPSPDSLPWWIVRKPPPSQPT